MSETVKKRIRAMLDDLRSNRSTHSPKVERHAGHVVVVGADDPLRKDFASSGKGKYAKKEGAERATRAS